MIEKIKGMRSNKDVLDTIIVGGATLFGSVFSYLLQFVLGRKLSVGDYGTFNALLSLSSMVGVFGAVFGTALIKINAEIFAKKDNDSLRSLFISSVKFSLAVGLFSFLIIFSLREFISNYLNVGDSFLITLFGLSVGLGFLIVIPNSYLQGTQEFKKYSLFHIFSLFLRFLIPTIFVFMGFGLRGVYSAAPISSITAFLFGLFILGLNLKNLKKVDVSDSFKKIFSFGSTVILVNFSMMALNNIDLIMVKRFFSPTDAGYYAGTMTLGKILLFGAGAVSVVMFPKITALHAGGKSFMKSLKRLLMLLILVLVVGVICYQIFPEIITNLFFGKAFENSVKYLPLFSVFVALYVLINFLVMFFLAIDKKKVGFLLLPGVLIQYIALNLFHGSLWEIINVNIGVSVFTLILLSVFFYFSVPDTVKKQDFKVSGEILDVLPD